MKGWRPGPARRANGTGFGRLLGGVLLWLLVSGLCWTLVTPAYNRFLAAAGENLVRLTERPSVTRLDRQDAHYGVLTRSDLPTSRGVLYSIRLTDLHFNSILLGALFLGASRAPLRDRLANLGFAALIAATTHVLTLFLFVKFVYATQLGSWSLEHYGAWGRNFWGLSKHLADLPFKLALPLILWATFHFQSLLPGRAD